MLNAKNVSKSKNQKIKKINKFDQNFTPLICKDIIKVDLKIALHLNRKVGKENEDNSQ